MKSDLYKYAYREALTDVFDILSRSHHRVCKDESHWILDQVWEEMKALAEEKAPRLNSWDVPTSPGPLQSNE